MLVVTGGLPLRPGVDRLLDEARSAGVRLAIATTTSPDNVTALLRASLAARVPTVVAEAQYTQGEDFSGALAVLPSLAGVSVSLLRRVHAQRRS